MTGIALDFRPDFYRVGLAASAHLRNAAAGAFLEERSDVVVEQEWEGVLRPTYYGLDDRYEDSLSSDEDHGSGEEPTSFTPTAALEMESAVRADQEVVVLHIPFERNSFLTGIKNCETAVAVMEALGGDSKSKLERLKVALRKNVITSFKKLGADVKSVELGSVPRWDIMGEHKDCKGSNSEGSNSESEAPEEITCPCDDGIGLAVLEGKGTCPSNNKQACVSCNPGLRFIPHASQPLPGKTLGECATPSFCKCEHGIPLPTDAKQRYPAPGGQACLGLPPRRGTSLFCVNIDQH